METTLTERGQTAVPARIRKLFSLKPGQKLEWVAEGEIIYMAPVARDPIAAFRGPKKGASLSKALLKARREDARRI